MENARYWKHKFSLVKIRAGWVLKLAVLCAFVAFIGILVGGHGLTQKKNQEAKRAILQRENANLQTEIKSLEREVTLLREHPRTIEKAAKRKLGMARPEETVYIFESGLASTGSRPQDSRMEKSLEMR